MKEMIEETRRSITKNVLELIIPEILEDNTKSIDLKDFEYSPADILDILEELGWEYELLDENGWEQDTVYLLTHPTHKGELLLDYSGFYWTMYLQARN